MRIYDTSTLSRLARRTQMCKRQLIKRKGKRSRIAEAVVDSFFLRPSLWLPCRKLFFRCNCSITSRGGLDSLAFLKFTFTLRHFSSPTLYSQSPLVRF
jgi:hypothetical protein